MFTGFTPQTTDFLWNLRFNNSREWFQAHRSEYQTVLHEPFRALANEVFDVMNERLPELNLNLHISRIYRDARRLYGRGPMKDHLWFTLFSAAETDAPVPSYFFSFEPEGYFYGVGFGSTNAAVMARFRNAILKNPAPMTKLAETFSKQSHFKLTGETYVRSKGDVGPLLQPWFDRRRICLEYSSEHNERGYSSQLRQDLLDGFAFLTPYYRYLLQISLQAD